MKQIGLGIGILLFAVLLQLCSSGMDLFSLGIGTLGLACTVFGAMSKSAK